MSEGSNTFQLGIQVSGIALGDFDKITTAVRKLIKWQFDEEITAEEFGGDIFLTAYVEADSGEAGEEILELVARKIWEAVGEFCPIQFQLNPLEEGEEGGMIEFDEADYEDIMREV